MLEDSETGEQIFVDTHDRGFRKRYAEITRQRREELQAMLTRVGVDLLGLSTEGDLARDIVRFAAARAQRRKARSSRGSGEDSAMTLQWPSLLWLGFLVPVLAAIYLWAQRRRRKYAARYASLIVVKDALGRGPGFRRHIPVILFLAGLSVGIFALSRPQATVTLPSNRGTVILAIDISGSMRARDIKPSRFEAAKAAARSFIEKQPRQVRVGIVAFAGTAALVQAPTTVREDLYAAIERLRPQRATAVGSAILVSLDAIFEDAKKADAGTADQSGGARLPERVTGGDAAIS